MFRADAWVVALDRVGDGGLGAPVEMPAPWALRLAYIIVVRKE